ncbi:putative phosphatidylinositol 3,4,5-trisphosphate 3-phosphatase TPTE2P1, partial [Plecturocebus cupreus]
MPLLPASMTMSLYLQNIFYAYAHRKHQATLSFLDTGGNGSSEGGVSLCHRGWSAVAQSLLTASSAYRVQAIPCLSLPNQDNVFEETELPAQSRPRLVNTINQRFQDAITTQKHLKIKTLSQERWIVEDCTDNRVLLCCQTRVQWCDLSSLQLLPLGSSNSPVLASQVAGTTGSHSDAQSAVQWCNHSSLQPRPLELKQSSSLSLLKMWFHHVAQAGLELLGSSDLWCPKVLILQELATVPGHCCFSRRKMTLQA